MKKNLIVLCFLFSCAFASDKLHVEALQNFSSENPSEDFKVKIVKEASMSDIPLAENDIIYLKLDKIKNPTRGKQDAKVYFTIQNYQTKDGVKSIDTPLKAKYAKSVISTEEIKKIPPKKIAKNAAGTVGSYFIKGFSYGLSFADGVVENPEGNRLKSGAKQLYDDSFLSYVEKGEHVLINTGDTFYLIVKSPKDKDEDENETEQQEINDTKNQQ